MGKAEQERARQIRANIESKTTNRQGFLKLVGLGVGIAAAGTTTIIYDTLTKKPQEYPPLVRQYYPEMQDHLQSEKVIQAGKREISAFNFTDTTVDYNAMGEWYSYLANEIPHIGIPTHYTINNQGIDFTIRPHTETTKTIFFLVSQNAPQPYWDDPYNSLGLTVPGATLVPDVTRVRVPDLSQYPGKEKEIIQSPTDLTSIVFATEACNSALVAERGHRFDISSQEYLSNSLSKALMFKALGIKYDTYAQYTHNTTILLPIGELPEMTISNQLYDRLATLPVPFK